LEQLALKGLISSRRWEPVKLYCSDKDVFAMRLARLVLRQSCERITLGMAHFAVEFVPSRLLYQRRQCVRMFYFCSLSFARDSRWNLLKQRACHVLVDCHQLPRRFNGCLLSAPRSGHRTGGFSFRFRRRHSALRHYTAFTMLGSK